MREFVQMLSPDKLLPFEQHPFQVREDESLKELIMYGLPWRNLHAWMPT